MSLRSQIANEFNSMNIETPSTVLLKCQQLCENYGIASEDFLDQWLAYAASHSLKLAPTSEALNRMEREELRKKTIVQEKDFESSSNIIVEIPEENPVIFPKGNFDTRSDNGTILFKFGKDFIQSTNYKRGRCDVKNVFKNIDSYLYEKLQLRASAINNVSRWIFNEILNYYKLEVTKENLKEYSGEMTVCGRIVSKSLKVDFNSVYLECFSDFHKYQLVKLNVTNISKLRLFNGQRVVVIGNNMRNSFMAQKMYTGAPATPIQKLESPIDNLQIFIAAGPFTLQENLQFEPLKILLKKLLVTRPNLIILIGPFLEQSHPSLQNSTENYEVLFETVIIDIVFKLKEIDTQIVLIPNEKDIHGHQIFPTLPYNFLNKLPDNVTLSTNPFLFEIDGGISIGGCSTDILFHLCKYETAKGNWGDRISQIIQHFFQQRNFYPLNPTEKSIKCDYTLLEQIGSWEFGAPHILILPSNLKHFVKVIRSSIVINPERLTKGNTGGSFAIVEIKGADYGGELHERISCIIEKV